MKINNIAAVIVWGLYSLAAGCCLFLTSMSISAELEYGAVTGLVAGAVVLTVIGLAVCGLGLAAQRSMSKTRMSGDSAGILSITIENILIIACLAGMIVLRLVWSWDIASDPVFAMAEISSETFAPVIAHRGMELYIYLLHGMFFIFGNKAFAALLLQIILSFCAVLSLYFGVRRLSGVITALTVTVFFCFTPYMLNETGKLSPVFLFLIFYGLAIRFIAATVEKSRKYWERGGRILRIVDYIAAGLLIGFCCYLDMAGVSLLILLTSVICFGGDDDTGVEDNKIVVFFICLAAATVGYVGSHGLRSLGGISVSDSITAQIEIYQSGSFTIPVVMGEKTVFGDVILMLILMSIGIYSFWYVHKIKDKAIWLFTALLLIGMQCFGMNGGAYFNTYAVIYLLCAAMAGCSLSDLIAMRNKHKRTVEESDDMGIMDIEEQNSVKDNQTNVIKNSEEETGTTPVINYIENPLPLPKKRVHKTLDYDYEVADDDDFDI